MTTPPKRPRGAPPGNLNALKHGFYARRFPKTELADLENHNFTGLAEEIALMRLLIRRLVEQTRDLTDLNQTLLLVRAVCLAAGNLNRLLKTHQLLSSASSDLEQSILDAFQRLADEKIFPILSDPDP